LNFSYPERWRDWPIETSATDNCTVLIPEVQAEDKKSESNGAGPLFKALRKRAFYHANQQNKGGGYREKNRLISKLQTFIYPNWYAHEMFV
jgi:hypothetical protein